mmetsp:Transcript_7632/g.6682  ORF Transcript_7632/g.6682 Transcript_7632/m.6682 type:complete len:216 (+) Transcript_7632:1149-1796(+)
MIEDRVKMNTLLINEFNLKVLKPNHVIEEKIDNTSEKMNDIENKMKVNGNVLRDIIRKLIYSIETSFISGKHFDKLKSEQEYNPGSISLMSLGSPSSIKKQDNSYQENEQSKDNLESVFLKRLNFLRKLLDDEIVSNNKHLFNNNMKSKDLFNSFNSGRIIFNTPKNEENSHHQQQRSFSNADLEKIKINIPEGIKEQNQDEIVNSDHVAKIKVK